MIDGRIAEGKVISGGGSMKALEHIWENRLYQRELSYTRHVGLILQPSAFTDFQQHPDFVEAVRRFTQNDAYRRLDFARIWSMVQNVKHVLSRCSGAVAELGVYQGQSAALLSFYASQFGRKMYLADTFSGFVEQQYEDDMGEGKRAAFKYTILEDAREVGLF
jgi:hypothetical protein